MRFIISFVLAATSVVCAAEQTEYEPGYEPDIVFLLCDRSGQKNLAGEEGEGHWVVLFDRANLWLGKYYLYYDNFDTDIVGQHVLSELQSDFQKGIVSNDPNGERLSLLKWDSECNEAPDNINFVGCGPFSKPEPVSTVSGFFKRLSRDRVNVRNLWPAHDRTQQRVTNLYAPGTRLPL